MEIDEVLAQIWLSRVAMTSRLRRSLFGDVGAILNCYNLDQRGVSFDQLKESFHEYKKQGIQVLVPTDNQYGRVFGSIQA